jgi:predicted dehydrogenase
MDRLRAGIIGCGGIAESKEMPAIKATGLVDMVAFCDTASERAAQEFGAKGANEIYFAKARARWW